MKRARLVAWFGVLALVSGLAALWQPRAAQAEVRLEGEWKDAPKVTLEASGVTRREALKRLAEQASWSLVVRGPVDDLVDVHIKDQPADKVLAVLLADGEWVAKNDGGIVSIAPGKAAEAAPAAPTPPSTPDAPPEQRPKKRDVKVFGERIHIGKDEVVHDVTVMGGVVHIEGRVTGKLAVFGGEALLSSSARVDGDAAVTGGRIRFEEGATIGGDLAVVGGSVEGAEGVRVSGSTELDPSDGENKAPFITRFGHDLSSGMRTAAFLFFLGTVFIALGGARAESVRSAIAHSPMRAIALGLVGLLGTVVALILVAVTLIGIPFAGLGAIAAVLLAFAGTTSALVVLGAMVSGHKTSNVYLHLAAGCGLYMVMGLLPWVGGLMQVAIVFAGIGGMVVTRAMGLLTRRKVGPPSPFAYR